MVNNIVKRLQNIMRMDAGINGDAQRIEQMVWMFFMKVYDTQEETWEYKAYKDGKSFESIIPEKYRWRNWAIDEKDGNALTGDALLHFINEELFPTLKTLPVTKDTPRAKSVVREVFADLNQYMKNGILLRQVINVINEIEFDDAEDRHMFGDIYEGILRDLQSAGNAGEFYTPRALTDFIIAILNPQLGETVGDFTSGTGGFLTSALSHLAKQVKTTEDGRKFQNAVIGQEWKPLPYLLSITNLLLHDVEAPNIRNCDSLGTKLSDFTEADKVNVIAMNPPYTEAALMLRPRAISRWSSVHRKQPISLWCLSCVVCSLTVVPVLLSPTDSSSVQMAPNWLSRLHSCVSSTCTRSSVCRDQSSRHIRASTPISSSSITRPPKEPKKASAPRMCGSIVSTCRKATNISPRPSLCVWSIANPSAIGGTTARSSSQLTTKAT